MITSTAGSSQTLSRQPMDDNSPSRGIIIVLSAGVSGVVVVLIAAAVIVIFATNT